jgi:hypothetical protein
MNVTLVNTGANRQVGAPQNFNQQQTAAPQEFPRESVQLGGNQGLSISTKNGIVSAVGGLAAGALALSGVVPGGSVGNWIAGVAVFALVKGVYHGFEEIKANHANNSPYSDGSCFKLGFQTYAKNNVFNGFIHSSINTGLAMYAGPQGALAGAAISGVLTKLTGM